ncbi:uncharacterized protein [Ptychodera flava]|uniref:uncharacterized protein n=1 Tax=Ptychodera flava TaxID=63121 RepID=UPI00396A311E
MDTPERIKLSRRAHRGQMTKILNQLDEFMETAEDGLNEAKLDKIQAKLELASAKLQQLQVLDQNLIDKTEDADLETVIVEADDYHSANKQSLREFYDATETYIRGLQSLGKDESSYGDLLVPIIMEKLPSRIRELITRDHGTPLLNDLVSILIRFRVHRYALSADIEKAFLQIGLHEDDRNFTKFLWLSDYNNPSSDFDVYRFKSVLFGAVSSPFILNTVVRSHLEANGSDVCQDLKENIYVDNAMSGAQTREDILNYHNEANEVMSKGGFNLRSWASNCTELRDLAREQGNLDSETTVNALGLLWNTESDKLSYKQKVMEDGHLVTKREVVRSTASIYDPLGFLAPVHVTAKCFIQELWKRDTQWDEPLPQSLSDSWCTLHAEFSAAASNFSIDRKYFGCTDSCREPYELHVFGDASTKAYGAVAYLRHEQNTALIMSKTRVAPIKTVTLPRLELMATLIAARLAKFIRESLAKLVNITRCVLWSDSQIVIHWVNNNSQKLPVFVQNRVREIRSISVDALMYCPTKDNPADIITRGIPASKLQENSLWWNGPRWLGNGNWPTCAMNDVIPQSDVDTTTRDSEETTAAFKTITCQRDTYDNIKNIIDPSRFCARRSIPRYMISDNATTYECAADELKTLFNSPAVKSYLANRRIDWKFIPKRAPWFGGFYERLIGITKIALKKVLGRSYVTFDELQTVVTEIEAIINDRPLTYTSSEFGDPQPLTPSHLLHGRQLTGLPYDTPDIEQLEDPTYGVTKSALQKRSDLLAKLLSHFWQRWSREYLTSLRERDSLNTTKGTTENVINVGDIVLVEDNRVPRMKWNLAVVENLNYGNDNLVRSAEIKTKFGRTNRPIKKLYPILELGADIDGNNLCDLNSSEPMMSQRRIARNQRLLHSRTNSPALLPRKRVNV